LGGKVEKKRNGAKNKKGGVGKWRKRVKEGKKKKKKANTKSRNEKSKGIVPRTAPPGPGA